MMFISKFNAMIRNRFLWGAFAILVVIAFVGWGTQGAGESEQMPEAGVVDGQPVSADEFRQAYFNAYVAVVMAAGRQPPSDARTEQALKNLAWKRLASMRQAAAMGLTVTDDEVAAAIRQQPFFQQDGVFDPARYMGFIQNVLGGMGVSERQFEHFLAQEIMLNKARRITAAMAWVAPGEVDQIFHQLYDEIKVGYVIMNLADMNLDVSLTEDDVRRYFDENRESFELPEQIRVKYVAVPHKDYLDPSAVTDEEIQAHYDENIENFTLPNDEGWSDAVPLDDVRGQIRRQLARERAVVSATEKAVELEMMLAPDRYG
ncbi:MAG: SurA N-terminal domain-containing protein, partial [Lentisphaerae bacterium]|nr:SurA N-terminal domain-containing protein [Lentisphaerota bacterium]